LLRLTVSFPGSHGREASRTFVHFETHRRQDPAINYGKRP
jgi:hypothetical protein